MKVAILCSGLTGPDWDIADNVATWRDIFPEADIFMGTWDTPEMRNSGIGWHVYYPDIRPHYNCAKEKNDVVIKNLRNSKNAGLPYNERDLFDIKSRARHSKFFNVKQFLSHIFMFNDFVRDKDYDLVLRVRPDTYIETQYKDVFLTLMNMVLEHRKPIGFETIDPSYEQHDHGWNKYCTEHTESLSDWCIAYNPKTFDSDLALQKYKDGKIKWAEIGWYQVLIEDQNVPQTALGTCWNGIVTLRSRPNQFNPIGFFTVDNSITL